MEFENLYELKEVIGFGSFGTVYRAVDLRTQEVCAAKVVTVVKAEDRLNSNHEAAIWRRLSHKNIVDFKRVFKTPKKYYLVSEYVDGGNLFDKIITMSSYTEHHACVYIHQLLNALDYCAYKRIIHRDIKPDNLLLVYEGERACVKLTDFGLSVRLPRGVEEVDCEPSGAPLYAAPEVILEAPIDYGVDVWACGIMLFILLSGYPPFWHEKPEKLLQSIATDSVSFPSPFWDTVSADAKDFIKHLLEKDKCKRITSKEALQHSWIIKESLAPRIHRHTTLEKLRVFNARRKLRGVIFTVQAMTRASRIISRLASIEEASLKKPIVASTMIKSNFENTLAPCHEQVSVKD